MSAHIPCFCDGLAGKEKNKGKEKVKDKLF
jgi:hypothetical protein